MARDNKAKPGRNEPCPCGSGGKYKHCCLYAAPLSSRADEVRQGISEEIHAALDAQSFDSTEDVQAFLNKFQAERNDRPMDDFLGLSPRQVHAFLNHPFDTPEVARFTEVLDGEPDAPLADLFRRLADAIGDDGLKPTATGNLPRKTCRDIMRDRLGEAGYAEYTRLGGISTEPDAAELHIARIVGELAGFIRKYRGRFILSRAARRMLATSGMRELYPLLFRAYVERFNWAYRDGFDEAPFVQQAWLFTAYLLHRHGAEERTSNFYADAFLRAFPAVEDEIAPDHWRPFEDRWHSLYTTRGLERFAGFTGLADFRYESGRKMPFEPCHLRARPLLDELMVFPNR